MAARHTLALRMGLACVLLVALTSASLMYFAHTGTISAIRGTEKRSLDNILALIEREMDLLSRQAQQAGEREAEVLKRTLQSLAADKGEALPFAGEARCFTVASEGSGETPAADGPPLPVVASPPLGTVPESGRFGRFFSAGEQWYGFFLPVPGGVRVCGLPARFLDAREQKRMAVVTSELQALMKDIRIQQSGFGAIVDASGVMVAGAEKAVLPKALVEAALDPATAAARRRVMVLPTDSGEIVYRLAYHKPLDLHIVLAAPVDELDAPAFRLVSQQLGITALVALAAAVCAALLSRLVTGSLRRLSRIARELPGGDIMALEPDALFNERLRRGKGEVAELARALHSMTGRLRRNVCELVSATARNQRIESELAVARDIQFGMLPARFPSGDRFSLHAFLSTAKEVGGDLYDFFPLDKERICLIIGDVSDKGVPAALFMSMTAALARSAMREDGLAPCEAMRRVNNALARDNPRSMFVTLCIGVLDLNSLELAWASAGHPPPVLLRGGAATPLAISADTVAGIFEGLSFKAMRCKLDPGDALLLYTDGLTDALGPSGERYGEARLLKLLANSPAANDPEALVALLRAEIEGHSAGGDQTDDMALLVVRLSF